MKILLQFGDGDLKALELKLLLIGQLIHLLLRTHGHQFCLFRRQAVVKICVQQHLAVKRRLSFDVHNRHVIQYANNRGDFILFECLRRFSKVRDCPIISGRLPRQSDLIARFLQQRWRASEHAATTLFNLVIVQLHCHNFVSFNLQQVWLDPVGEFRRHINLQRNAINIRLILTSHVVVRLIVLLHQLARTAAIAFVGRLFADDQINQHIVIGVSERDALANRVHVNDVLTTRIDHAEFHMVGHAASDQRVARNTHQRR